MDLSLRVMHEDSRFISCREDSIGLYEDNRYITYRVKTLSNK